MPLFDEPAERIHKQHEKPKDKKKRDPMSPGPEISRTESPSRDLKPSHGVGDTVMNPTTHEEGDPLQSMGFQSGYAIMFDDLDTASDAMEILSVEQFDFQTFYDNGLGGIRFESLDDAQDAAEFLRDADMEVPSDAIQQV